MKTDVFSPILLFIHFSIDRKVIIKNPKPHEHYLNHQRNSFSDARFSINMWIQINKDYLSFGRITLSCSLFSKEYENDQKLGWDLEFVDK